MPPETERLEPHLFDPGPVAPRPSRRRDRDAYFTPDWATQELLKAYPQLRGGRMLDPCCGDGRMAERLRARFDAVLLNDIDRRPGLTRCMDARNLELYAEARPDWVVTNPPFMYAGEIARLAVESARFGVALLMRCTFLEPCSGREWLTRRPPSAILALPRVSFTGGGTDSAPCWWFLWGQGFAGIKVVTAKEQAELWPARGPHAD